LPFLRIIYEFAYGTTSRRQQREKSSEYIGSQWLGSFIPQDDGLRRYLSKFYTCDIALSAYLEAKQIKNTYLLHEDVEDEDVANIVFLFLGQKTCNISQIVCTTCSLLGIFQDGVSFVQ